MYRYQEHTPERIANFELLAIIAEMYPDHITYGYIGNFERWGDDRMLHFWLKSSPKDYIWCAEAKTLSREDVARASAVMQGFSVALKLFAPDEFARVLPRSVAAKKREDKRKLL